MSRHSYGMTIEGFANGAYHRILGKSIDARHFALADWSQADVSGSESNFQNTKSHAIRTMRALVDAVSGSQRELCDPLVNISDAIRDARNVSELAQVISDNDEILSLAYGLPNNE